MAADLNDICGEIITLLGPFNKAGIEIVVHPFDNLLIDCAHDVGAGIIIRGLRAQRTFGSWRRAFWPLHG